MAKSKKSFAETHPELAKEWHPTKNESLTPYDVTPGSGKKVWWKCEKGDDHEWEASIKVRALANYGCKICSGKEVVNSNCLKIVQPKLASEWHPSLNGILTPNDVTQGARRIVWWKCHRGEDHEWQATISSRSKGAGCPICIGRKVVRSNSLTTVYPEIASQWDFKKNIGLSPHDIYSKSNLKIWWKCSEGDDHEWESKVANRASGNGCPICSGKKTVKSNSLKSINPELALQWHPIKNHELSPDMLTPGSGKSVWWKCHEGSDHEWQAPPSARLRGNGCPVCANKKVVSSNSLAMLYPKIGSQWYHEKNGNLKPSDVSFGSDKKVWWKCAEGADHIWESSVRERTKSGTCPICTGKRTVYSNSLAALHPDLALEWNREKNLPLLPSEVRPASHKKIWWKCSKINSHEWQATVKSRKYGTGCPYCSGNKVDHYNSLLTINPELANDWHPNKNESLTPADVTVASSKKVWWKCSEADDHEWEASVSSRNRGNGCPICRGFRVVKSNSLLTLLPDIAKEWHPTRNVGVTPDNITIGSRKIVWWQCPDYSDHVWKGSVLNRKHGNKCAVCAGQQVVESTSLNTLHPQLASEWHSTKNNKLTPNMVTPYSGKQVWWKCNKGDDHEWKSTVANRVNGNGCSICYGQTVVHSNCLSTTHPIIAEEWHPDKNSFGPDKVIAGSDKKVWWQCSKDIGHEWKTSIGSRSRGNNCPYCSLTPQSRQELIITFELKTLFKRIDPKGYKTRLEDRIRAIDIFIPKLNLCIEFDGSYWHKDKREIDKIKSNLLLKEGYSVIRVREEPLKKIYDTDVISKQPYDGKKVTNDILSMILSMYVLDTEMVERIKDYQSQDELQNEKGLNRYIDKILKERAEKKEHD